MANAGQQQPGAEGSQPGDSTRSQPGDSTRSQPGDSTRSQPGGSTRSQPGVNTERLREHARAVQREGQALAGSARDAVNDVRALAQEQLEARPYGVLALAFGAGWLLGGGLPLRMVVFVGGIGARLAAQELLRTLRASEAQGSEASSVH